MNSPVKRLTRTYILALFALAMTAIVGQVVIQRTLSTAKKDGHAIDLAGRQRMLSERIVKNALLSQNKELVYARRLDAREKLAESIDQLRYTHRAFRFGDEEIEIQAISQPILLSLFDELQPSFEKLISNANEVATAEVDGDTKDQIISLEDQQCHFVKLMNEIVVRMSTESAKKVSLASNIEYWLLGITLCLLLSEGIFVFYPAVEQVQSSFEEAVAREQELVESERRHRDLFEFSAGPLLCLHPETGHIIGVNPAAANALEAPPEQLCGKRFHSFLTSNSAEKFDDCIARLDTEKDVESQLSITTSTTIIVWASRCVIYRSQNERPYVLLSGHDVTQQIEREQQLILANQRDDLTGLLRRAELDARIKKMAQQHQATGAPFVIAMIDIDHFKSINDEYGHQAGDEILKVISRTVKTCCRHADIVARYGGEELVVVYPQLSCDEAAMVTNRLRETIRNLSFKMVNTDDEECIVKTSVSIGLAGAPMHSDDAEKLMKAADDAMYQAKCAGRNRVCIYSETAERKPERRQDAETLAKIAASHSSSDVPIVIEVAETK